MRSSDDPAAAELAELLALAESLPEEEIEGIAPAGEPEGWT